MMRLPRRFRLVRLVSLVRPARPAISALVLGGIVGAATLFSAGTAEAGHAHFSGSAHFSGHVGWHGGAVHFARPAWRSTWRPRPWVGGSVWVGGGYYYPRTYYYYYAPEAVPSYYGSTYYPVQPSAAPGIATAAPLAPPAPPSLPSFGIGVFAGGSSVQNAPDNRADTSDLGALARFRLTPGLLVEGELAKTSFKDNERVDRRLGGSLIYEIGAQNTLAPYVLAGLGVQQADVDGSFTTTQDFGEIGVGLRWALSRNLHLAVDIRAGSRKTIDSNQPDVVSNAARTIAPPSGTSSDSTTEDYTRGRLAAILNF
jgi:hypothetical protein